MTLLLFWFLSNKKKKKKKKRKKEKFRPSDIVLVRWRASHVIFEKALSYFISPIAIIGEILRLNYLFY